MAIAYDTMYNGHRQASSTAVDATASTAGVQDAREEEKAWKKQPSSYAETSAGAENAEIRAFFH